MGRKKEIPDSSELVDYGYTVAGHAGTLCDADGLLFIKPCTQGEIDFYESANAYHPDFAQIMPEYMGSLTINGKAEVGAFDPGIPGTLVDPDLQDKVVEAVEAQSVVPAPDTAPEAVAKDPDNVTWIPNRANKIKTDKGVVLENATRGFVHPNILDAKLGRRLWADDAPLQKKERFDKIAAETTHGSLGFRIAGMRTYRGSLDKGELNEDDYKIYDKDYGRVDVNDDNVVDALRRFIFNPAAGIDVELGKAVAAAFVRDLRIIEESVATHESRMYSASLLFVFEGDGDQLSNAIDANNEMVDRVNKRMEETSEGDCKDQEFAPNVVALDGDTAAAVTAAAARAASAATPDLGRTSLRVDSGIALMTQDGEDDDEDEDDDDGPLLPMMYRLKLIDFAHAQWAPGQGPDENALTGIRSLLKIFEQLAE